MSSRIRRWWRNESYDRDDMRAFRVDRADWVDVPDEFVAQSLAFQAFALGRRVDELGGVLRSEFESFMHRVLRKYFKDEEE